MSEKPFGLSDDELGAINTFGEEKGPGAQPPQALIPQVVDESHPAHQRTSSPQTAMAIIGGGKALQQVRTQYVTAVSVQKPRDMGKIQEAVLKEADMAGASFMYGWNVKDKRSGKTVRIEGPSIDMAMSLVRNYGNCVLDTSFAETETHFVFDSFLIDLESGTTIKRQFRQRRSQSLSGKMDKDRQEDIVFQIGQSKAGRNVVTRAMPGWLIEKAIEASKDGELKRIDPKQLPKYRQLAVKFFSSHDVEAKLIEDALGKPMDKWMAEDIVELKGMMTALKEGRATTEELFPSEGGREQKQEEKTKETAPKTENPPPSDVNQVAGQAVVTGGQASTSEPGTGASQTQQPPASAAGNKGTRKKEEPPEAPPAAATPSAAPPAIAGAGTQGQFKLGIVKCPEGGMRKGKLVHTRWCNDNCKQHTTCEIFKAGPQAAV